MRTKPIYVVRVFDDIFIIYKISNYTATPITPIHCGLAYTAYKFSDKLEKLLKKYNLNPLSSDYYTTTSDIKEFYSSLYVTHSMKKLFLPKNAEEFCKIFFYQKLKAINNNLDKTK